MDSLSSKLRVTKSPDTPYTVTLFAYKDAEIKNLMWALKYYRYRRSAKLFASYLYDYLLEELSDEALLGESSKKPLLIPIPVSSQRYKERGYNQVEWIIEEMISKNHQQTLCAYDFSILKRQHNPDKQARIKDKQKREESVRDTFKVTSKEKIEGQNIILIDDVTTTGATLKEARRTLLAAGAKSVRAIAIAH